MHQHQRRQRHQKQRAVLLFKRGKNQRGIGGVSTPAAIITIRSSTSALVSVAPAGYVFLSEINAATYCQILPGT